MQQSLNNFYETLIQINFDHDTFSIFCFNVLCLAYCHQAEKANIKAS